MTAADSMPGTVSEYRGKPMMKTLLLSGMRFTGIFLIITATVMLAAYLAGLLNLPAQLFAAESTVHSITRLAVIGCIFAAIGSSDL